MTTLSHTNSIATSCYCLYGDMPCTSVWRVANKTSQLSMPKRAYRGAFSFVSSSPTHPTTVLNMDLTAPPPPNSTTPGRRFVRTRPVNTPEKLARTFAPSFQPLRATQLALQESLTGNVIFANESIVDAIFRPSKLDDQIVADILAEINGDKALKTARDSVLSSKLADPKQNKSLVRRRILSPCGGAHIIP